MALLESVSNLSLWQLGQSIDEAAMHLVDAQRQLALARFDEEVDLAPRRVYLWDPQQIDLRAGESSLKGFLHYLLTHADSNSYNVKKGDSVDRILRNQFFVSGSLHPRAYAEYFAEIVGRNGLKKPYILHPDQPLRVPMGPHYSALEASIGDQKVYLSRAHEVFCFEPRSCGESATDVGRQLYHAVGRYSWIFPSPLSPWSSPYLRKKAVEEIIERRILPAGHLDPQLEREPVVIYEWSLLPASAGERRSAPGFLSPVFRPAALPSDKCTQPCRHCIEVLKTPDLSKASHESRILVVDTGVDPLAIKKKSAQDAFYSPNGFQYGDLDDVKHGTFVYSETVSSLSGPLDTPKVTEVMVAKIAHPSAVKPHDYNLSMAEAIRAFQNFGQYRSKEEGNRNDLPVWVVNLSMYGRIPDKEANIPLLIENPKILFVAAAGNDTSGTGMNYNAYTALDHGNSNVLTVGALDQNPEIPSRGQASQRIAWYSNRSSQYLDLFTQGTCVCGNTKNFSPASPDIDSQIDGTSQAAPIASVAAKILAEKFSKWNAQQVKWRLISTTDLNLPDLEVFGPDGKVVDRFGKSGRLNLPRALNDDPQQTLIVTSRSQLDQAIHHVDSTTKGWTGLLTNAHPQDLQILRLHQIPCPKDKTYSGQTCFEAIRFQDNEYRFDELMHVDSHNRVYFQTYDGKSDSIEVQYLREVIQPMLSH